MQWFTPPPIQIALSESGDTRHLVAIKLRQGKAHILKCWNSPPGPIGLPRGPEYDEAVLTYGLAASETLLRPLELKLSRSADIEAVLPFETEPLLPFPIEEAVFDAVVTEQSSNLTHLNVVVARKTVLSQRIDTLGDQGFEPETVTTAPLGLASLNPFLNPDPAVHLLIHFGETEIDCVWAKGTTVLASANLSIGLQRLPEDCRDESPAHSTSPKVQDWWSDLRQSFHRSIVPLNRTHQPKMILLGPGSQVPSLQNDLAELLRLDSLPLTLDRFDGASPSDIARYALPIGLALSAQTSPFNFRKGDLAYPHPWRRYKPLLLRAWALGLILATTLYFTGQYYVHKHSLSLYQHFTNNAAIIQADTEVSTPESLEELSLRISEQEELLESATEPFPLQPQVPRVEDFLAWLTSHPQLHPENGGVTLDKLHYSMVKRPQRGHVRDRYQVKVELEIRSELPRHARSFHDSLVEEKKWIDQKQTITWTNTSKGGFRASFFLKDRTRYFGNR